MSRVVLITGCSTGIGRDLAQRLTQAGYTVVATARHAEALNGLQAALKLSLDVAQPGSVYQPLYQKSDRFAASMRGHGPGPEVVSQVIRRAIEAPRPKARYLAAVALPGRWVLFLRDFVWDGVLGRMF